MIQEGNNDKKDSGLATHSPWYNMHSRRFLPLLPPDFPILLSGTPICGEAHPGSSAQHISAIEQDKRAPSLTSLAKLAEELGVTVDYLVTGKEGVITDTIPAIKADKRLKLEVKKALITLVQALHSGSGES